MLKIQQTVKLFAPNILCIIMRVNKARWEISSSVCTYQFDWLLVIAPLDYGNNILILWADFVGDRILSDDKIFLYDNVVFYNVLHLYVAIYLLAKKLYLD